MMANISSCITLCVYGYCLLYDYRSDAMKRIINEPNGSNEITLQVVSIMIVLTAIGRMTVSFLPLAESQKRNIKAFMTLGQVILLAILTFVMTTILAKVIDLYINIVPMISLIEIAVLHHCILKVTENYDTDDDLHELFRAL